MGRIFQTYLNSNKIYCCKICKAHLSLLEDCVSRQFRSAKGAAFLFARTVNVYVTDKQREETFTTGRHIVSDIFCTCCNYHLGWKYLFAYESTQKYKENKYILEAASIVKNDAWRRELAAAAAQRPRPPRRGMGVGLGAAGAALGLRDDEFDEEEDDTALENAAAAAGGGGGSASANPLTMFFNTISNAGYNLGGMYAPEDSNTTDDADDVESAGDEDDDDDEESESEEMSQLIVPPRRRGTGSGASAPS